MYVASHNAIYAQRRICHRAGAGGRSKRLISNKALVMILRKMFRTVSRTFTLFAALLCLPTVLFAENGSGRILSLDQPHAQAVVAIQRNVTHDIMNLDPGVLGTAVGVNEEGDAALLIYIDRSSALRSEIINAFPANIRGIPVQIEETDRFVAFSAHTAKQGTPIQLGTSGGWSQDLANGYCCGGTLGSLV